MTNRMTNSCTLLIYTPVINGDVKTDEVQSCKTVLNFFLINFKARILRFWSKSHLSSLWSFRSQESQKIKEISKILSAASIPSLLLYHWALFACCSFKPSLVCLFVCWRVSCITDGPGRFFGRESFKAFLGLEQSSHFRQTSCRTRPATKLYTTQIPNSAAK